MLSSDIKPCTGLDDDTMFYLFCRYDKHPDVLAAYSLVVTFDFNLYRHV